MIEPPRAVLNMARYPRRWLTLSMLTVFVLGVVGSAVWLTVEYWRELLGTGTDPSGVARNVGLLAGGVVAIGLAIWRCSIAERPVEVAERRPLDELARALRGASAKLVRCRDVQRDSRGGGGQERRIVTVHRGGCLHRHGRSLDSEEEDRRGEEEDLRREGETSKPTETNRVAAVDQTRIRLPPIPRHC